MEIIYGMKTEHEDPYVKIAREALEGVNEATTPGKFLVEIFPIMTYIPSWFPGAGWRKKVDYWRDISRQVRLDSFKVVKNQVVGNIAAIHHLFYVKTIFAE
jgi:hypothetical protein